MSHAFKKQPLELYGNVVASTTSAQMATACASEQCPYQKVRQSAPGFET
jgi:hypothetical protein